MQINIASNITQIEVLQSDNMTLCTEKEQAIMQNKKVSNQRDCGTNDKKKKKKRNERTCLWHIFS